MVTVCALELCPFSLKQNMINHQNLKWLQQHAKKCHPYDMLSYKHFVVRPEQGNAVSWDFRNYRYVVNERREHVIARKISELEVDTVS